MLIDGINEAIFHLNSLGVDNEDIRILCSTLVEQALVREGFEKHKVMLDATLSFCINGVRVSSNYPFNDKIFIYHEKACMVPELLVELLIK